MSIYWFVLIFDLKELPYVQSNKQPSEALKTKASDVCLMVCTYTVITQFCG